jgi:membrane-bound inhibitor of C-type lysozyme
MRLNKSKKIFAVVLAVFLLAGIFFLARLDFLAMKPSSPQSATPDSRNFTGQTGGAADKSNLIRLDSPQANQVIHSPLTITGQARGTWFFEASFPVILTNWDGLIIAQGIATAKSDWTTEDFVPFEAVLEFDENQTYSNRGFLILKKDNPSGLPEHDDALEIPVLIGAAELLNVNVQTETSKPQVIGGDKDAGGCLIGAGYSWCEAKQACIRVWEEYCTAAIPRTAVFNCAGAKTITATFYPADDKFVDLNLGDDRKLSVPRAISAFGARYAKADESFVFWNKGDTAFITENGVETFSNCVIKN